MKEICENKNTADALVQSLLQKELESFAAGFLSQAKFSFLFVNSRDVSLVRAQSDVGATLNLGECLIQISHDSTRWGFNPFFYGRLGRIIVLIAAVVAYDENIQASFVIDPSDGLSPLVVWNGATYDYPSLAYSSFRQDSCLVVDPYFLRSGGYAELRQASLSSLPTWSERSRLAVWRGSAHGHRLYHLAGVKLAPDWSWHQRLHLCAVARQEEFKSLMDVGVVNYDTLPKGDLHAKMDSLEFKRPGILKSTFACFKYIIDVDGFSNSWPGLFSALLAGSCVLKVASALGFKQWYYDRLVPWRNFVPVAANLEDLPERLEWVNQNDEAAREIGEAGRRPGLFNAFE